MVCRRLWVVTVAIGSIFGALHENNPWIRSLRRSFAIDNGTDNRIGAVIRFLVIVVG